MGLPLWIKMTHQLNELTPNDVFDQVDSLWVRVLNLSEHEHLRSSKRVAIQVWRRRTICEISWVYLYSLVCGLGSP